MAKEVWGVPVKQVRSAARELNKLDLGHRVDVKLTGEALAKEFIDVVDKVLEEEGDEIIKNFSDTIIDTYNGLLQGGGYLGDDGERVDQVEPVSGTQEAEPQEEPQEDPEPRVEEPEEKPKPQPAARGKGKPGVIQSILETIREKGPVTKEQILEELTRRFPDRNTKSMRSTIQVQIGGKKRPLRLEREKGVTLLVEDGKYSLSEE